MLPPNKAMLIQNVASWAEVLCPQWYPTKELLIELGKFMVSKSRKTQTLAFIGTIMWSSIFGTPHVQIHPTFDGSICTIIPTDTQKFTAIQAASIIKDLNKKWVLCMCMWCDDGTFAIMTPDFFLGTLPWDIYNPNDTTCPITIQCQQNATLWYALYAKAKAWQTIPLYAHMARDLSWSQWLGINGVEMWSTNLVFEKEVWLYIWIYTWIKRWCTNKDIQLFFNEIFGIYPTQKRDEIVANLIQKSDMFIHYVDEWNDTEIETNFDHLTKHTNKSWQPTFAKSDIDLCIQTNNILQKRFIVAFFSMKWVWIDTKRQEDKQKNAKLLQGEDMRHIYNLCRGKDNGLVTPEILKTRFGICIDILSRQ